MGVKLKKEKSLEERKFKNINLMNVILCLSVVMIHLIASPLSMLRKDSIWYFIIFIINKSLCFCVPAFLFLSGFKLHNKYKDESIDIKKFYLGRIKKIVIPYIVSFLVYFIYLWSKKWINTKEFVEYFFLGTLVAHFYYIIIALQAYLLFPLLQKMFIKYDKILLVVSLICTILFQAFIFFEYLDRFVGSYIFYFVFGMYVAKYNKKIKANQLLKRAIIPFIMIAIIHITFSYMANIGGLQYRSAPILNIIYVILAILILYSSCILIKGNNNKLNNLIEIINKNSYYIYLYHILIIFLLQNEVYYHFNLSIRYRFIISVVVVYLFILAFCMIKKKINDNYKERKEK